VVHAPTPLNPVYNNVEIPNVTAYRNGIPENLMGMHEAYVQQMMAYMQQFGP